MRRSGRSFSIVASKVGTQAKYVTRRSSRKSARSLPTRLVPGFPGTSAAPASSGTQSSSTEKSKAIVMP